MASDASSSFGTILMDPPWPERGGGRITRGAQRHYPLVALSELPHVIRSSPLWRPRPSGCLLWCWATTTYLEAAFALVRRLGFVPCTGFVWAKVDELEGGAFRPAKRMGLGQRSRQEHEHLLVARVGKVPLPPPSMRPRSVIYAARGRHSEKPAEVYGLVEATSPGPYAELFARNTRPGWLSWGNEAESYAQDA